MQPLLDILRDNSPCGFAAKGITGIGGSALAAVPQWVIDGHQIQLFMGSFLGMLVALTSLIGIMWGLVDKWRNRK